MWRWIVALFLALQLNVLPAFAQSPATVDRLEVNIWPEYDRPSVLVIYRASLSADVSLPAQVTLRIPRSADQPYSVAMEDADGLLYSLEYTVAAGKDWLAITFITPRPNIQLEYYDPRLKIEDQKRMFQYTWPGDYRVDKMYLSILQPPKADEMVVRPGMGEGQKTIDGKIFYTRLVEEVPQGVSFTLNISYQKPDTSLATTPMPVRPVEPITPRTTGRMSTRDLLGWVLGVLGALLIVGGALWFWRSGRGLPEQARKREAVTVKKDMKAPPAETGEAIYCRQCGRRASRGDVYCRTCGAKLN